MSPHPHPHGAAPPSSVSGVSPPPERNESSMSRSIRTLSAVVQRAAAVGRVRSHGDRRRRRSQRRGHRRRPGRQRPRPAAPAVTRAALDPALVAGRGASVDFVEQEAENAATNGTVIGPDRTAYTLPAEASGRSAVKLTPGQYVEFTLPQRGQRDHRALQHPRRADRRRHHRAARRHGQRRRHADDDAHLAVLLALQPVPVHATTRTPACCTRTGGSPSAPACRPRPRRRRRSPRRSGPTTSTTSSGCCSARPTRPATRSG